MCHFGSQLHMCHFYTAGQFDTYVSNFVGEQPRRMQLHMCQFFRREAPPHIAPYASIFSSGSGATHIAPYVSIYIEEQRGGYSSICVKFILTHMCQFIIRKRRDAYSSICVNLYRGSTRRVQLHMCQIFRQGATRRICVIFFIEEQRGAYVSIYIGERRGVYNAICAILLSGSGASLTQFNYLLASL